MNGRNGWGKQERNTQGDKRASLLSICRVCGRNKKLPVRVEISDLCVSAVGNMSFDKIVKNNRDDAVSADGMKAKSLIEIE